MITSKIVTTSLFMAISAVNWAKSNIGPSHQIGADITIIAKKTVESPQYYSIDTLKIGDPAPPIVVRKWLKGDSVATFKTGMVYAVEFWATWCGPCQAAMPHLSELARKYKGKAIVLSFDVLEDKKTDFLPKVEKFVKWSGDRMDYNVAVDAADGTMDKTWLAASGASGIPEIFIIDQKGRLAWHGHPNYVDDVLQAVVNDNYDEAGRRHVEALIKEKTERYDSLSKEMMDAKKNHDYAKALAIVDQIMPLFPGMHLYLAGMKYEFLYHSDPVLAKQYAELEMTRLSPKDQLSMIYGSFLRPADGSYKPDDQFALKWAKQAAAKSDPEDLLAVKLLARLYYQTGNKTEAVENQKKFIEIVKKNNPSISSNALSMEQKTLETYQAMK